KSRTFCVTLPIASVTLLIAPLIPSAIDWTMFLPASLKLPKKPLTVLNADVIPFLTAFLTPLKAVLTIFFNPLKIDENTALILFNIPLTIVRAAFNTLDIIFFMPDNKLDVVLLIVFQAPFQSPVMICMTVLIIPLAKFILVSIIDLIKSQTACVVFLIFSQEVLIMGTKKSSTAMITDWMPSQIV